MITQTINQPTMTSLQIAEIGNKRHCDLMRAIRKMEDAWFEVNGRNFACVDYIDAKGEVRPCYNLTKEECLYVATKFSNKLRAMLVKRWMELEQQQERQQHETGQSRIEELQSKVIDLQHRIIKSHDETERLTGALNNSEKRGNKVFNVAKAALRCLPALCTISDIAVQYDMTARYLNDRLEDAGVIVRRGSDVYLADRYGGMAKNSTYETPEGEITNYLKWTRLGQAFIYLFVHNDFNAEFAWSQFNIADNE